jgi:8-oxo-dGTP pyrophosphatase MutT (NUDIX family)
MSSAFSESNSARWFPHVTVASIAIRDGKYLMVEEHYQGSRVLNQPAGHVEKNESLEQAVVRETLEETGWNFQPEYISGIYQFIASNGETYIRFTFFGYLQDFNENYQLDPAIEQTQWLSRKELEISELPLRSQVVLKCISDFESGNRLPTEAIQQLK